MRSTRFPCWMYLCALSLALVQGNAGAQVATTRRLPARAVIQLGGTFMHETMPVERRECRSAFRVTAAQVRHRFATWREIDGTQYDLGSYVYLNCGRSGIARVDSRTFTWTVNPEDTMTTSWPDGQLHWYVRRLLKEDE